jgi:hypothetical protein
VLKYEFRNFHLIKGYRCHEHDDVMSSRKIILNSLMTSSSVINEIKLFVIFKREEWLEISQFAIQLSTSLNNELVRCSHCLRIFPPMNLCMQHNLN